VVVAAGRPAATRFWRSQRPAGVSESLVAGDTPSRNRIHRGSASCLLARYRFRIAATYSSTLVLPTPVHRNR
jgi:hypothetical protein